MTNIYLIRHAESDTGIKNQILRPLTAKGEIDAVSLLNIFKYIPIDAVYSSPYKRTVDTLKHIAEDKNKKIIISEKLCERKIGIWIEDFFDYAEKQWKDFSFKISGGESLSEARDRNIPIISEIVEKHKDQNIIIGTHGTAMSLIINHYDKKFGYDDYLKIADKMPCIFKLTFDKGIYLKKEAIEFRSEYEMIR